MEFCGHKKAAANAKYTKVSYGFHLDLTTIVWSQLCSQCLALFPGQFCVYVCLQSVGQSVLKRQLSSVSKVTQIQWCPVCLHERVPLPRHFSNTWCKNVYIYSKFPYINVPLMMHMHGTTLCCTCNVSMLTTRGVIYCEIMDECISRLAFFYFNRIISRKTKKLSVPGCTWL